MQVVDFKKKLKKLKRKKKGGGLFGKLLKPVNKVLAPISKATGIDLGALLGPGVGMVVGGPFGAAAGQLLAGDTGGSRRPQRAPTPVSPSFPDVSLAGLDPFRLQQAGQQQGRHLLARFQDSPLWDVSPDEFVSGLSRRFLPTPSELRRPVESLDRFMSDYGFSFDELMDMGQPAPEYGFAEAREETALQSYARTGLIFGRPVRPEVAAALRKKGIVPGRPAPAGRVDLKPIIGPRDPAKARVTLSQMADSTAITVQKGRKIVGSSLMPIVSRAGIILGVALAAGVALAFAFRRL